jgi:hypothetical protein
MTDTHAYDGLLSIKQLSNLIDVQELSLEQKKERGNELANILQNPTALKYLREIITCIGSSSNFDSSNNMSADDLIALCWIYRYNPNFINELEIQLSDMSSGFCPQGRTHRLFQLILAFNHATL